MLNAVPGQLRNRERVRARRQLNCVLSDQASTATSEPTTTRHLLCECQCPKPQYIR
jgi:hypothetical protein